MTKVEKKLGSGSSSECPRAGYVTMISEDGELVVQPTSCKTWRCVSCRDRVMALFKARVTSGCSILGTCAFITVTYKADTPRGSPASYVATDWAAFLRKVRLTSDRDLKWLRVMEITKKMMPHHHVVMGTVEGKVSCYGDSFDIRRFDRSFFRCHCLSHRLSRLWLEVTGDSRIVHTVASGGARGAAGYMGKYLQKTFGMESRLKAVGMTRRWSTGRGWPGSGQLRFTKTVEDGWLIIEHGRGRLPTEDVIGQGDVMDRSGDSVALALRASNEKRSAYNRMKKGFKDAESYS